VALPSLVSPVFDSLLLIIHSILLPSNFIGLSSHTSYCIYLSLYLFHPSHLLTIKIRFQAVYKNLLISNLIHLKFHFINYSLLSLIEFIKIQAYSNISHF
jgi:hypothetical protein